MTQLPDHVRALIEAAETWHDSPARSLLEVELHQAIRNYRKATRPEPIEVWISEANLRFLTDPQVAQDHPAYDALTGTAQAVVRTLDPSLDPLLANTRSWRCTLTPHELH